jgi:hypothetical protein
VVITEPRLQELTMNEYIAQKIAQQRMDEAARFAQTAHIRRAFARTPARWHFPRVNWHVPVLTQHAGV